MRGVYFDGQSLQLRTDLPPATPGPGETILRVRTVGICDTDLQLAKGYMDFRGILGHEFVAEDSSGHRFTAEINNACHACPTCLAGLGSHCPYRTVLGILDHDGAMADLVSVPSRNLHAIPNSLDDLQAVFIEPLAAAFRIAEQVPLDSSTRLTVVGDGKLGILCARVARLMGCPTSLVGKHPQKLAMAGPNIRPLLLDQAGELARSQDVVVDCTGSSSGLSTALSLVKPCGTVVMKTTVAGNHSMSLASIVIDEVRVIGSRCGPFARAIAALTSKEVEVTDLIEAEFSLNDAEAGFRAASNRGARKVLLRI